MTNVNPTNYTNIRARLGVRRVSYCNDRRCFRDLWRLRFALIKPREPRPNSKRYNASARVWKVVRTISALLQTICFLCTKSRKNVCSYDILFFRARYYTKTYFHINIIKAQFSSGKGNTILFQSYVAFFTGKNIFFTRNTATSIQNTYVAEAQRCNLGSCKLKAVKYKCAIYRVAAALCGTCVSTT